MNQDTLKKPQNNPSLGTWDAYICSFFPQNSSGSKNWLSQGFYPQIFIFSHFIAMIKFLSDSPITHLIRGGLYGALPPTPGPCTPSPSHEPLQNRLISWKHFIFRASQVVMDAPPGIPAYSPYVNSERNFLTRPPIKRSLFLIILSTFISSPASALQMLNN